MERRLRADARKNQDRLLTVAVAAFLREGGDTSMTSIARDAGVGIGTLYRCFPTRGQLVEAVYRSETERLASSASSLLAEAPPALALRRWFDGFLDYMLANRGVTDALSMILDEREGSRQHARAELRDSVSQILEAGISDDTLRADVPAEDVLMAIAGVALVASHEAQGGLAARLADLLLDSVLKQPR